MKSYKLHIRHIFTNVCFFNSGYYICLTCDRHLKKSDIPCQAVWNKLGLSEIPDDTNVLNQLEKVLISKRILFKKILIMLKGQHQKMKGEICKVPIQAESVDDCLPQGIDSSGIIFVKLKRRLQFKGRFVWKSLSRIS